MSDIDAKDPQTTIASSSIQHSNNDASEAPKEVKIWDIPTRVFHWSLVLLFIASYATNALGPSYFNYHLWCGYAVLVLVVFRILWGVVGTYHAQFIHFVRNPVETIGYAIGLIKKSEKHYGGHNPLGAIMVLLLLGATLVQALTGLFTNDEIFNLGPLYAYVSDELSLKLTSIHRQLFYWILGAIALHIAAVYFHHFIKREKIIKAMFTGKKPAENLSHVKPIKSSRIVLAIILLIVIIAVLVWIIKTAPVPVSDPGY